MATKKAKATAKRTETSKPMSGMERTARYMAQQAKRKGGLDALDRAKVIEHLQENDIVRSKGHGSNYYHNILTMVRTGVDRNGRPAPEKLIKPFENVPLQGSGSALSGSKKKSAAPKKKATATAKKSTSKKSTAKSKKTSKSKKAATAATGESSTNTTNEATS